MIIGLAKLIIIHSPFSFFPATQPPVDDPWLVSVKCDLWGPELGVIEEDTDIWSFCMGNADPVVIPSVHTENKLAYFLVDIQYYSLLRKK